MWISLAVALALQPSPAVLRQLFEEAFARQWSEYGEADVRTAQAARDLGLFLAREGDRTGARDALAQAVRIDEKALGAADVRTLADVAELAAVSEAPQAEALWQRAARTPDPVISARSLAALGGLREMAGDRAGAAKLYRQALDREEAASGKDSLRVAVRLNALARVVEPAQGVALFERALRINLGKLGARHLETATIEANLADLLLKTGRRRDDALRLSRHALSVFEEMLGPDDPRTAVVAAIAAEAARAR